MRGWVGALVAGVAGLPMVAWAAPEHRQAPAVAAAPAPAGPPVSSDVGYPSVDAAMMALSGRPDVRVVLQGGWMVFDDQARHVLWAFPGKGTPPYPSVVKRTMAMDGKTLSVQMSVLCEAAKPACDALVADFRKINADLEQHYVPKP